MTKYRIKGTFPDGCEGYFLRDYADAAGVSLYHDTEEEALVAIQKIENVPDVDDIVPACYVCQVEVDE